MSILRHVSIKAFKSILDQKVELGQLNVIIGHNGSGKSNFLEAIGLLSAALSGEIEYQRLAERGVRLSSPDVFRSAFSGTKRQTFFTLEGAFERFIYHASISAVSDEYSTNPWGYHGESVLRGKHRHEKIAGRSNRGQAVKGFVNVSRPGRHQSIVTAAEALGVFHEKELQSIEALRSFAIFSPSTPILRGVSPDNSNKAPLGLYGGGLAEALLSLIKSEKSSGLSELKRFFKLLDWFQMISVTRPSKKLQSSHVHTGSTVVTFSDRYMSKNFKSLYAYDVSEGALYILFILMLLIHREAPNIFALDNVDSSLNPGLVATLMKHATDILSKNKNKQVFFTTHNPATLDAIDLFNESHRLFVCKRNKEGHTELVRISPPPKMTREEWDEKFGYMKLSEIWLSGLIEGISVPEDF